MARRSRVARLYGDDDLRVLWLTLGRQELALSVEGIWVRGGRRAVELAWSEVDQIQATPVGGRVMSSRVRVEVFTVEGPIHTAGPFPTPAAERWLRACAQAATEHGERLVPLDGAMGFAVQHS